MQNYTLHILTCGLLHEMVYFSGPSFWVFPEAASQTCTGYASATCFPAMFQRIRALTIIGLLTSS